MAMRPDALAQARERLEEAERWAATITTAGSMKEKRIAWANFLHKANAVHTKLEAGSKDGGKAAPWFGRFKHERGKDQLLIYIHQARNADEHGLEEITESKTESGVSCATQIFGMPRVTGAKLTYNYTYLRLVPVTNFGVTYAVPTEHLGHPITDPSPITVSSLALDYLRNLLARASTEV